MPVPKFNLSKYKPSENERKFHKLTDTLFDMGYDIRNVQDIIDVIGTKELNIPSSDYPYGSFEEFKKHKNDREFEMATLEDMMITKEKEAELEKAVKEGRLWITY